MVQDNILQKKIKPFIKKYKQKEQENIIKNINLLSQQIINLYIENKENYESS